MKERIIRTRAGKGARNPARRFPFLEATRVCAASALILWLANCASGQVQGQVHGLIQDARGYAVAGARVVAHDSRDNGDGSFVSGPDGSFKTGDLKPGRYLFKAAKPGFGDSPVSELDLHAGEDLNLNLTLGANQAFLKRLVQAYAKDFQFPSDNGPDPPRRAPPSPLSSPPFPSSDWSYGAAPAIGVPDTNVPPLMQAIYAGANGDAWEQSGIKLYGWLDGSLNLSTSGKSNFPSINDAYSNRFELDQGVFVAERIPDTVQTDHLDWGFRVGGLFGISYRFTTDLGYFSQQLLKDHRRYGFDPEIEYADLYIPGVASGLDIRIGRMFTLPGIESQIAPGNYTASHSLLYYASPTTNTGIIFTVKLSDRWLIQAGITAGNDVAPWTRDAKPSASACIEYTFNRGNDDVYPCVNGLNDGKYAFNNLQIFDSTWYHKFNASWHMATEAFYMYQLGVPGVGGPVKPEEGTFAAVCPAGQIRCRSSEWALDNYIEKQLSSTSYVSLRSDFLDDAKGQQTGIRDRYAEATLMWGHWLGSNILLRPEIRFDRAMDRPAYDEGTRKSQFQATMDVIFKF